MIRIPLVGKFKGWYALVDDCDKWVLKFRWRGIRNQSGNVYVRVSSRKGGLNGLKLHRLVLCLKKGDPEVDHIDGNGLNCQRCNLRAVSRSQNQWNRKGNGGRNAYKGITWNKHSKRWQATIQKKGKQIHIGCYASEIEAARAYDKRAKELFSEYARLNFPESWGRKSARPS